MAQSKRKQEHDQTKTYKFDTDSVKIAIINCASFCITLDLSNFIGTPKNCDLPIQGIGSIPATKVGTIE